MLSSVARMEGRDEGTHSRVAKWYPMHALEPPRKLMMLPHTPGRACAPGGMFSQRSGLNNITIASARNRDGRETSRYDRRSRVPEFSRILSPDAFVSVQGKDRDKHAVSLGNSDRAQSVNESIKPGPRCGVVPDPRAVRERQNVVLHSDPRSGWNGRVQPQPLSHDVIQVLERLDLLHIWRICAKIEDLAT